MRVLVCGSRSWTDADAIRCELNPLPPAGLTILHGACRTGADWIADEWCREFNVTTERFPANWRKYGKGAGPMRNRAMLDTHPDLVLAFRADGPSPGTDDMIREAQRRRIPVKVIYGPR